VGLAVLAFLLFLQARDVRRLREWAGRAPERAAEAAVAQVAAAEVRQEAVEGPPPSRWQRLRARAAALRDRVGAAAGSWWEELDRRSPVDPKILAGAVAVLVAVAVAAIITGGFGLGGSESNGGRARAARPPSHVRVAVLNGTQENGVQAVAGLASKVAHKV